MVYGRSKAIENLGSERMRECARTRTRYACPNCSHVRTYVHARRHGLAWPAPRIRPLDHGGLSYVHTFKQFDWTFLMLNFANCQQQANSPSRLRAKVKVELERGHPACLAGLSPGLHVINANCSEIHGQNTHFRQFEVPLYTMVTTETARATTTL